MVFATGFIFDRLANIYTEELEKLKSEVGPLVEKETKFKRATADLKKAQGDADQFASWLEERYYWGDILSEVHRLLIQTEIETGTTLHTPTGVWVEKLISYRPSVEDFTAGTGMPGVPPGYPGDPSFRPGSDGSRPNFGGDLSGRYAPPPAPEGQPAAPAQPTEPTAGQRNPLSANTSNEVSVVTVICRAVNVTSSGGASSPTDIAFAVEQALKGSPLFDKDGTQLSPTITPDEPSGTFSFEVNLKLKRPLKL